MCTMYVPDACKPEEYVRSPGIRVTGSCEVPRGARKPGSSARAASTPNHCAISSFHFRTEKRPVSANCILWVSLFYFFHLYPHPYHTAGSRAGFSALCSTSQSLFTTFPSPSSRGGFSSAVATPTCKPVAFAVCFWFTVWSFLEFSINKVMASANQHLDLLPSVLGALCFLSFP